MIWIVSLVVHGKENSTKIFLTRQCHLEAWQQMTVAGLERMMVTRGSPLLPCKPLHLEEVDGIGFYHR